MQKLAADVHLCSVDKYGESTAVHKKVLIVDDSPAEVRLMQGLLEKEGYWPIALHDPRRDAETGDLREALGPMEARPPESQYCVFRSGGERFCLPVLDVEEVLDWPLLTRLPLGPAYLVGIFNLRGAIVPLIDIAITEGRRQGLLPKHVVGASLRSADHHEDIRIGIAADEVIGTYSVHTEDLLEQAPENVPHCIGMLRHDDRLALVIDLRRLLEVFPGPSI